MLAFVRLPGVPSAASCLLAASYSLLEARAEGARLGEAFEEFEGSRKVRIVLAIDAESEQRISRSAIWPWLGTLVTRGVPPD